MMDAPLIDIILVPQGAEFVAIQRGLRTIKGKKPQVVAIPIGPQPLERMLCSQSCLPPFSDGARNILVMGVCGSLTPRLLSGDVVVIGECLRMEDPGSSEWQPCDANLTKSIASWLRIGPVVRALTMDRVITTAEEKGERGKWSQAEVVEMEGFMALKLLSTAGHRIAMLRVISDDCSHDIPDLSAAITEQGNLLPIALAWIFLRNPLASLRLIRGSLTGLQSLQRITTTLCSHPAVNSSTGPAQSRENAADRGDI